jgi:excisionase family DNA binding protein
MVTPGRTGQTLRNTAQGTGRNPAGGRVGQQHNTGVQNALKAMIPELITVDELKVLLDIGRDTAYTLVRRKDFPSIKLGREYRVVVAELAPWLLKQQRNK